MELTSALTGPENAESFRERHIEYPYFDDRFFIDFYRPHDWPRLAKLQDRGVAPERCKWYQTRSAAVLANGDLVICCLDQFAVSKRVNIMDIDELEWAQLSNRELCRGCTQYNEMDDWIEAEALSVPRWLSRREVFDTWT